MTDEKVTATNANTPMTVNSYREALVQYGTDHSNWPIELKTAAIPFLETAEGQRAKAIEGRLDQLFADAREEVAMDADTSDFFARLSVIPEQHEQEAFVREEGASARLWASIVSRIDRALSPKVLFSPAGFVSQGAACAVLLFAGVAVGMSSAQQGGDNVIYDDTDGGYDLTAGLFGGGEDVYSFED